MALYKKIGGHRVPCAQMKAIEDRVRRWPSAIQWRRLTQKTRSSFHLDYRLPASRTMRKQITVFKSPTSWYAVRTT